MTVDTCIQQARQLPAADQIELVQRLWDTIAADEAAVPVTDAQKAELDRRMADLDGQFAEGKSAEQLGRPWEQVKRRVTGQ